MDLHSIALARAFERGEFAYVAGLHGEIKSISAGETARCAEWIALACAALGKSDEAVELFRVLARVEAGNPSHLVNLGVSLLATGKARDSHEVLRGALARWPLHMDLLLNYGIASFAVGRNNEAARVLASVVSARPADDLARLYAVRAAQEIGRPDDVRRLLEGWRPQWQSFALAELYEYAKVWIVDDQAATAEAVLRHIRAAFPDEVTAAVNLAALYERANRLEEAGALLASLPTEAQSSPLFVLAQAKLLGRAERIEDALATFDRALAIAPEQFAGVQPDRYFSEAQFERGRLLDRLHRCDEAMAAFSIANRLIRDLHRRYNPAVGDGARIEWLADQAEIDAAVTRPHAPLPVEQSPIFIVGFPRSGTTLLDQMLDAHPALQVLEEKPALEAVVKALAAMPRGYPGALLDCDDRGLDELRAIYRQAVDREIARRAGARLVDKYPFNMVRIQLAMTLFPGAKWIFAVRHPCDVVLSCFMQNFKFTDVTHGFWSLEQTASIYAQIMGLWLEQRQRLRPDCLDLRYEDLVSDFERTARALIAFLGLDWDDRVLSYHQHARSRRIATPSYSQVIKPIYGGAAGRWQRYRRYFDPVLPVLQPYVHRLGYAE